jgi:hypothetical protein
MAFDGYAPEIINGRAASELQSSGGWTLQLQQLCAIWVGVGMLAGMSSTAPACAHTAPHAAVLETRLAAAALW